MKKPIVLSVITALLLFAGSLFTPSYAQAPTSPDTPTFYRLVPGAYVNPWPRFTVTYPKDWIERRPSFQVFRIGAPGEGPGPGLSVAVYPGPIPMDRFADVILQASRLIATDVTIVSDKPSRLPDGTRGREVESRIVQGGVPVHPMGLAVKKGDLQVHLSVIRPGGRVGEDLKAILYSIQFQPGKDEPIKVPADIQVFLDRFCSDMVSHDVAKVMTHYSHRYLDSGNRKGEVERIWRQMIGPTNSFEVGITDFETVGDRVHLAGFWTSYWGKTMLIGSSIIKENGEWKWFGNQRDVAP